MTIELAFDQHEKERITNNDTYDVFRQNLKVMTKIINENNYKGRFYIKTRRYNNSCPLDFNWMRVTFPNGDIYELEFAKFKIKNHTKVQ